MPRSSTHANRTESGQRDETDVGELAQNLRAVTSRLTRVIRAQNVRGGLSALQYSLLSHIEREGAGTQVSVAAAERITPQAVAQALAPVEQDGLITRRPLPEDRRVLVIELTNNGRRVLDRSRTARQKWLTDLLGTELDDSERRALADGLAALARLLDAADLRDRSIIRP